MRLGNSVLNLEILFEEGKASVLVVENKKVFNRVVEQLWKEIGGEIGEWVLSECEKTVSLSKCADIVFNPYSIDANDRKVLNKLYSELSEMVSERYMETLERINGCIVDLLSQVEQDVPYFLKHELGTDFTTILKIYNVQIDSETSSLLERLIDYIRAYNKICKVSVFIFVNLKDYLESYELEQLYEFSKYEKLNLLLIESHFSDVLDQEKTLIYDKDMCIINV